MKTILDPELLLEIALQKQAIQVDSQLVDSITLMKTKLPGNMMKIIK
ncbi:hypothetical protein BTHERMOSOX_1926 [Bathymodiolus thermophilus thioautotrophic gill symbiont]|nr:hypothetical protein BTHERMOSOX_1926 [Bathymodiolus thermophilus thioautotrophic gill symbiont]